MLFLFIDSNTHSAQLNVSERHGSEIKQLSVIGHWYGQKVTLLSFFGPEVDIIWRPVAATLHKPSLTFNKSVAQVQLNHHKYTSLHHRTWQEYYRK